MKVWWNGLFYFDQHSHTLFDPNTIEIKFAVKRITIGAERSVAPYTLQPVSLGILNARLPFEGIHLIDLIVRFSIFINKLENNGRWTSHVVFFKKK